MTAQTSRKKMVRAGIAAGAVVLLFFLFGGVKGLSSLYRLHRNASALERELESSQSTVDSLKREIVRLRSDTAYIERLAREKLGMARKDETIYKFVEER